MTPSGPRVGFYSGPDDSDNCCTITGTMSSVCRKPGCGKRVFVEPRTGIAHDYCGRTHALEHLGGNVAQPHGICHTCKLEGCDELAYFDVEQDRVHDFCCLSHAQIAMDSEQWPRSLRSLQFAGGDGSTLCSLPGCSAPRFRDPISDELKDFCGRTHAIKAKQQGLLGRSRALEDGVERVWPSGSSEGEEPGTVSMMTRRHRKYDTVKQQFIKAWHHPGKSIPTIMRIYQVAIVRSELCHKEADLSLCAGPEFPFCLPSLPGLS